MGLRYSRPRRPSFASLYSASRSSFPEIEVIIVRPIQDTELTLLSGVSWRQCSRRKSSSPVSHNIFGRGGSIPQATGTPTIFHASIILNNPSQPLHSMTMNRVTACSPTESTRLLASGTPTTSVTDEEKDEISHAGADHGKRANAILMSVGILLLLTLTVMATTMVIVASSTYGRHWWHGATGASQQEQAPLLGSSNYPIPCDGIMIGVWTKTCLIEGMISYNYVSLRDGSFAELESDGLGFVSMYGTYHYAVGEVATTNRNCLTDYEAYVKQEPLDRWRSRNGSIDFNAWYLGRDFFSNEQPSGSHDYAPKTVSCRFERVKGQECRNRIARLLFHFANAGVSLSQYQSASDELC